jgi:uncharacterized protein (TIGR02757 family)
MVPNQKYIRDLLDRKYFEFNRLEFIPDDPVSIPHRFTLKEDIEISGFLAAALSWGQRRTIIQNSTKLMDWMDESPYDFILHHTERDLQQFGEFRHRTFNGEDCRFFLESLKNIYRNEGGLEAAFIPESGSDLKDGIIRFRKIFLSIPHPPRSEKHLADPASGSSAKRINMFLRWMVRKDSNGVDFGLWKSLRPSQLYCPLDVHTGSVARRLGILSIRQDNWKAVEELTAFLRHLDPEDPVRYDFALFGIGRYDKNNT